ncbi:hypothetical protein [Streptomyces sp. BRA346]|uniref:hypothetical protein n=1 Tax=Streptomyces sp. BRA346 TaxID=2878199 RepID=UPI004063C158
MTARSMGWLLRLVLPAHKGGAIADVQSGPVEERRPRVVLLCPPHGVVVIR